MMVQLFRKGIDMSQENMLRDALKKFRAGDSITSKELKGLLTFFERSTSVLNELTLHFDSGYSFSHENSRRNLEHLKCFQRARDANKKGK